MTRGSVQKTPDIPPQMRRAVQGELLAGEKLLYLGRPDWRAEWGKLLVMAGFGIGWCSIAGPMALSTVGPVR